MRSDREEIPEGYTKEDADKAEIAEAGLLKKRSMQRGASALAAPTDCTFYWPVFNIQVCGQIRVKYDSLGGSNSFLSFPTAADVANPDNYGRRQTFVNGPIYWSPATGAHPVVNSFLYRWGQNNYEAGKLKYPTTDEILLPDGGRRQEFQQGAIYVAFQNAVGAAIFNGPLRDKYNSVGGLTPGSSFLGYPTQDQAGLPDGQGQMDRFQNGVIYSHPSYGAHWVNGRVLDIWARAGYETGEYGYPTSDTLPRNGETGSADQNFAHGAMYVAANNYFEGLITPAAELNPVHFNSNDTSIRPDFTISPDMTGYGNLVDADGSLTANNYAVAESTKAYFVTQGAPTPRKLLEHYYDDDGSSYGVSASFLDTCLRSASENYNDGTTQPTRQVGLDARDAAIQRAITEAGRTSTRIKLITSSPWTSPVAAADQDCTLALGRFSMSTTTAVITNQLGNYTALQSNHLQDIYDFAPGKADYPGLAQTAVNNGYQAFRLGIAKPFLVYGKDTEVQINSN
ncbi:hypothetical protein CH275_16685 [Rhodococcus sp. 06-235-1A]|nr:hypothetical protein CH275_16685 [Rhodococcus sp. 06-235-1A]